jgi:hypothetical protein
MLNLQLRTLEEYFLMKYVTTGRKMTLRHKLDRSFPQPGQIVQVQVEHRQMANKEDLNPHYPHCDK